MRDIRSHTSALHLNLFSSASAKGCGSHSGVVHLNFFPSASAKGCEHDHHAIWFCCGLYEDYSISALSKEVDIVVHL